MTVAENLRVAIPAPLLTSEGDEASSMRKLLDDVGSSVHLEDRVGSLSVAQKHLLELAKAFALSPKLLILDEPTAPLGQDSVDTALRPRPALRRAAAPQSSTSPTGLQRSENSQTGSRCCGTAGFAER